MPRTHGTIVPVRSLFHPTTIAAACLVGLGLAGSGAAHAFQFDTGGSDVKVRWDNTIKYTAAFRVNDPDTYVANGNGAQPNTDFGDLAFKKGLINNRVDLLSELDVLYQDMGFRLSGAGWYDAVYNKSTNDFNGGAPNTLSQAQTGVFNSVPEDTKKMMGRKAEFLDAFVYKQFGLAEDSKLTLRAGKHTQLYGETLFLGANGIAGGMGPVDLIKAYSLPNAQFKEIAMPVGQVSADLQLTSTVSVGAYYQYKWKPLRLPSTGSYFSPADFVAEGGDILLTPFPFGAAVRQGDLKGKDSGNFGGRLKFKFSDTEYGLYAIRYDDKAPIPVLDPSTASYRLMYARGISAYGGSLSTVLGETNVAVEMSTRRNTPLAPLGDLIINSSVPNADNESNTPYARGNSFHLNISAISVFPANALWQGASVVGEFAYNRLLSVKHSPVPGVGAPPALNSTHTRDHSAFRVVFQPEYFQVLSGVDLQVPIGLGYGLHGRSAIFQVVAEHGGDFSIGVNAEINKAWKAGISGTHYFGSKGPAPDLGATTNSYASYKQYYADRDFISLTVQRTF